MRRLLAAWVLAVLAAGCGPDANKPAAPKAEPNPKFDKEAPRWMKKAGPTAG